MADAVETLLWPVSLCPAAAIWLKPTGLSCRVPKTNAVAPTDIDRGCWGRARWLAVDLSAICVEARFADLAVLPVQVVCRTRRGRRVSAVGASLARLAVVGYGWLLGGKGTTVALGSPLQRQTGSNVARGAMGTSLEGEASTEIYALCLLLSNGFNGFLLVAW